MTVQTKVSCAIESRQTKTVLMGIIEFICPVFVFGIILILSLCHHFLSGETLATFFADSRHYLETCREMVLWLEGIFCGAGQSDSNVRLLSDSLMLDGPILPLMPALFFALLAKVPMPVDWQIFVVFGCLIHSLSAALVFLLARRLTNDDKWGIAAGIAWGMYPAAIIAAGRYLTEPLAAFLLLVISWLSCRLPESLATRTAWRSTILNGAVLGSLDGVLLLLKPPLVFCCLFANLAMLVCLRSWKLRTTTFAAMLAGLSAILFSWAFTAKILSGSFYLTPQRVPVYNVAKGYDLEADGWGCLPDPPFTVLQSNAGSTFALMLSAWHDHPLQILNLSLRKVGRLFADPWNDFRTTVFAIPAKAQAWWHTAILFFAALGGLAVLSQFNQGSQIVYTNVGRDGRRAALLVGYLSLLLVFAHMSYLPFEAINRYGFTAMPFMTLLAIYGLFTVCSIASAFLASRLACLGFCASFLVLLALCAAAANCIGNPKSKEWSSTLSAGDIACRQLNLSARQLVFARRSKLAAVLVDGDASCNQAIISVNGHKVDQHPISLLRFAPSHYYMFDVMRTFAGKLGRSVDDLRQWRIVTFPVSWLNLEGVNVISIAPSANRPVTIYGDNECSKIVRRHIPAFYRFSAAMLCNAFEGFENRISEPIGLPHVSSVSWLEHKDQQNFDDLSADVGRQGGEYRLYLVFGMDQNQNQSRSRLPTEQLGKSTAGLASSIAPVISSPLPVSTAQVPSQTYVRKLSGKDFDILIGHILVADAELRINKPILKSVSRLDCLVPIPKECLAGDYLRIRVSGYVKAAQNPCQKPCTVSIVPELVGTGNVLTRAVLPATPPYLLAGTTWRRFEISDDVPTAHWIANLRAVSLSLFPGAWEEVREYGSFRSSDDACFRNLEIEFQSIRRPCIDDKILQIY